MKKAEKTIVVYICEKCGKEYYDYVGESMAERTCRFHECDCRCTNKPPLPKGTLVYAGTKILLCIDFSYKRDCIWNYRCHSMFSDGAKTTDGQFDIIEDEITGIVDNTSFSLAMAKIEGARKQFGDMVGVNVGNGWKIEDCKEQGYARLATEFGFRVFSEDFIDDFREKKKDE